MAIIGDALRLAFMPKQQYASLSEGDRAFEKLQKPLILVAFGLICLFVFVPTVITLRIVFPGDSLKRPFCRPLSVNFTALEVSGRGGRELDLFPGSFALTDQETVDYFWIVVFLPTAMFFAVSAVYLVAGISVAYTAPAYHACLKVVKNNYCASRRGGVRCLSIVNTVFAAVFGVLALFLGSTLLTLGSSCSLPLFWCYEISSWSLVILYGGVAVLLRRKSALILDTDDFYGPNIGIEMLQADPEMEKRINEGFKSWMGTSSLSSEEDELDNYQSLLEV